MALPERKRLRLKGYDYSTQGCYFITVLTDNRKPLFWDKSNNLTWFGQIAEDAILDICNHHFAVKIDNYAIMPDHIHLLVTIGCDALPNDEKILVDDFFNKIKYAQIPDIIGCFKSSVTRKLRKKYPGMNIWHRSYYDHIINNINDYSETWDYIENNPNVWIEKQKENRIENQNS